MLNRINAFLFLTVLTATISGISIASAEAQARIMWVGTWTYDLSDPDSVDGVFTIEGVLEGVPEGVPEFSITSVRPDGATLRCRKSHVEVTQEFPEKEYVVDVTPKAKTKLLAVQFTGMDGKTALSGMMKPDDYSSLRATVTVARSRVFFTGLNDVNANVELCTARLAVKTDLFVIIDP